MFTCLQIRCAKYCELRHMFYEENCTSSKLVHLLDTASKLALFSVSSIKDKKLIKKHITLKMKHANSMLEYFEYFYQMSSKSIFIISRYTVSKLVHFFWDTVYIVRTTVSASHAQVMGSWEKCLVSDDVWSSLSQLISVSVFQSLSNSTVTPVPLCLEAELVHLENKHHWILGFYLISPKNYSLLSFRMKSA